MTPRTFAVMKNFSLCIEVLLEIYILEYLHFPKEKNRKREEKLLPIHSHHIPTLIPSESVIESKRTKREESDTRNYKYEESGPAKIEEKFVRKVSNEVDRKYGHKNNL